MSSSTCATLTFTTLAFVLSYFLVQIRADDPNFKNIYKQTTREVQNQVLRDISGTVPAWIDGDFLRQNCASFGNIDGAKYEYVSYVFDCIPMVGRYLIQNGEVKYSNKQYATEANEIWKFYGHDMSRSKVRWMTRLTESKEQIPLESFKDTLLYSPSDSFWRSRPDSPVLAVSERIHSATEITLRPELRIDRYNFEFQRTDKFKKWYGHCYDQTPSEQTDADGTIWAATIEIPNLYIKQTSTVKLAVVIYNIIGKKQKIVTRYLLGEYNLKNCPFQHENMPGFPQYIETTPSFILVPQTSYRYDLCQDYAARKLNIPEYRRRYKWNPKVNTSILVFERSNMSKVHHVYMPFAKFFSHSINAFEDATHIFLDTLAYENIDTYFRSLDIKSALANSDWTTSFLRIAIDKRTWSYDAAKTRPLTSVDPIRRAEFPTINYEAHHQKDYTFVYFVANALYPGAKIAKLNVKTKQIVFWDPPVGYYPQEPIFVQSIGATKEDEGVILCSGPISNPPGKSFLAILNATDLKQIAMVRNPNAAPFGLHNRFYKNASAFPPASSKASTTSVNSLASPTSTTTISSSASASSSSSTSSSSSSASSSSSTISSPPSSTVSSSSSSSPCISFNIYIIFALYIIFNY